MDYDVTDIPEIHQVWLRASAGVEEVPEKLVKRYWEVKRVFDRTGTIVTARDIAFLCVLDGFCQPLPSETAKPTISSMLRAKKIPIDQQVTATFRGQKLPGRIRKINGQGKVVVALEDGNERAFSDDSLELAQ